MDQEWIDAINVVTACEGEMGGGYLPSQYLDEANLVHELKRVIGKARSDVRRWKEEHKPKR